ncbi:MAG: DUF3500 domain-containing protein [Pirellulaceae bacterium]
MSPLSVPKYLLICLLFFVHDFAAAQEKRSDYVSDASFVVGTHRPKQQESNAELRASTANAFLDALTTQQRQKVLLPLDDPERQQWTNLPPSPDALGLRLGDLDQSQVAKACDMLATMLSKSGYEKMCQIMLADDQLLPGGRPRGGLGTEKFALVIFGTPSVDQEWAFQLDGHHIGVNLTFEGSAISISPSFIGTQPELFQIGSRKIRPLTKEIDVAYRLVNTLNDEQRKAAVLSPRRGTILTGPGADGKIPPANGVACKSFSAEQKSMLRELAAQWINDLPEPQAKELHEKFAAEIDEMKFSWNGALTDRSDISYALMSPEFIIEFSCQGASDKPLDHIHTMFRVPSDEYGAGTKGKK